MGYRIGSRPFSEATYDDQRHKMIAYGRWEPFTSPTRAQAHLNALAHQARR